MIRLIYHYLPGATCTLWPKNIDNQVEKMLNNNFPDLRIVYYDPENPDHSGSDKIKKCISEADLLVHSSGPGVIGLEHILFWMSRTKKPYGVFGVTISNIWPELRDILNGASFVYTRETASLDKLKAEGILIKNKGFTPDSTFAIQLANDKLTDEYLSENDLVEKEFLCVIPRLRYTPYHKIYPDNGWTEEKIRQVTETNEKHQEQDAVKLRETITWWIRNTGHKVVVCPEMTYQTEIMDPLIVDPLPSDVRKNVVKHDYWLPDEAASLYRKAYAVISMECHSPIISLVNHTPAFYIRQPQDTIKGQMYHDLGLSDWVFEIEETGSQDIIGGLKLIRSNYKGAGEKIKKAFEIVREQYDAAFNQILAVVE